MEAVLPYNKKSFIKQPLGTPLTLIQWDPSPKLPGKSFPPACPGGQGEGLWHPLVKGRCWFQGERLREEEAQAGEKVGLRLFPESEDALRPADPSFHPPFHSGFCPTILRGHVLISPWTASLDSQGPRQSGGTAKCHTRKLGPFRKLKELFSIYIYVELNRAWMRLGIYPLHCCRNLDSDDETWWKPWQKWLWVSMMKLKCFLC